MTKQEIELVEVLITISIVSKRLAHNLMRLQKGSDRYDYYQVDQPFCQKYG